MNIDYVKYLRVNSTPAEKFFWKFVRNKQFHDLKFRRQHPIGNYIVDFCCTSIKAIIEIDGDTHSSNQDRQKDCIRTHFLSKLGYNVFRYNNRDVLSNIDGVIKDLESKLPLLLPLKEGERKNNSASHKARQAKKWK